MPSKAKTFPIATLAAYKELLPDVFTPEQITDYYIANDLEEFLEVPFFLRKTQLPDKKKGTAVVVYLPGFLRMEVTIHTVKAEKAYVQETSTGKLFSVPSAAVRINGDIYFKETYLAQSEEHDYRRTVKARGAEQRPIGTLYYG